MYIGLQVEYPLYISGFNGTRIFLTDFRKIPITNFKKIRPVGAEMFHTDGQTGIDISNINSRFSQFCDGA